MALFYRWDSTALSYMATTRRKFTFYHFVVRSSWYSFDRNFKRLKAKLTWKTRSRFEPETLGQGILRTKHQAGPILDTGSVGAFFQGIFSEKKAFCLLAPPMLFLTISNENIFFKPQGTRLGAIVAPNKGPEQALLGH